MQTFLGVRHAFLPHVGQERVTNPKERLRGRLGRLLTAVLHYSVTGPRKVRDQTEGASRVSVAGSPIMQESDPGILFLQSNRVNTDTGEVSVMRFKFYKSTKHLLFEHKTKEIKQDIKIVKLNISNLENVLIWRLQMFMKTLTRRSFIH